MFVLKTSLLLIGTFSLIGAVSLFLLFTDQPLIKLLRFTVLNSFELEGDEIGTVEKDIVFKTVNGRALLADIYMPLDKKHELAPAVVFSHGGGWVVGDRKTMFIGPDNKQLIIRLRNLGYVIANFEYRLLNETVTLADIVADNKDMVRWLRANAEKHGIDANNIGFWGQSAGGHLGLMVGLTTDTDFVGDVDLSTVSARVAYVVNNYGPADLAEQFRSIVSGQQTARMMAKPHVEYMFESSLAMDRTGFMSGLEKMSPINYVDETDPPILIVHGAADTVVYADQSRRLEEALIRAGTDHEAHFIAASDHIFNGATPAQITEIVEITTAFISRNTR